MATIKRKYKLYFYLANYNELKDTYKKDLEIQFENIKALIKVKIEELGAKIISHDHRSILIDNPRVKDFKTIHDLAIKTIPVYERVNELLKDLKISMIFKMGIILDEEVNKRHPFKKSYAALDVQDLQYIILSEKAAISIIENYNIERSPLTAIWFTDGKEISQSEKLRKIYLNRDEEEEILSFIDNSKDKVLLLTGEIGSGKSQIIKEISRFYDGNNLLISLNEKKHSVREFRLIIDIIDELLFGITNEPGDVENVINYINSSSLPPLNKNNLSFFVNKYHGDVDYSDHKLDHTTVISNLKQALKDSFKLNISHFNRPICIIIDNYQFLIDSCEEIFLEIIKKSPKIKFIFASNDKDILDDKKIAFKKIDVGDLDKNMISRSLKLMFPHKIIPKKTVDLFFDVTGGNFYILKEYAQYLLNKGILDIQDKVVKLKDFNQDDIPDNLFDIFETKLNSLSKNANNIFKIITILGDEFYFSDLDSLLHNINYPMDEKEAIRELFDKGLIENEGNYFKIVELSIVESVYQLINPKNKKLLHNLLGEIFEQKGIDDFSFKIFYHYYRAKNWEKLFTINMNLLVSSHSHLNYNALENMIDINDRILYNKAVKDVKFPIELWCANILYSYSLVNEANIKQYILRYEKIAKQLFDKDQKECYLNMNYLLGMLYGRNNNKKKLQTIIDKSVDEAKKIKSLEHQANFHNLKAKFYFDQKKIEAGNNELNLAIKLYASIGYCKENDLLLENKALSAYLNKSFLIAMDLYKELGEKYYAINDYSKIYEITDKAALISLKLKDYKQAEDHTKQLISYYKDSDNLDKFYEYSLNLGIIHSNQNRFLQAISAIDSIITGLTSTKNSKLLLKAYLTLGTVYQYYDEYAFAEKNFIEALQLSKKVKSLNSIEANYRLGVLLLFSNKCKQAKEYFDKNKPLRSEDPLKKLSFVGSDIAKLAIDKYSPEKYDKLIISLEENSSKYEIEIIFELYLSLLIILSNKKNFIKVKEVIKKTSKMTSQITDSNKLAEYRKLKRSILKTSSKNKGNLSHDKKVSPSVKKRLSRRKTNM
ncbi:MAG: tetratricopeptide repeat protein [Candidatus Delongbacteria bacterium]|jgi:tetratricopeptide (TPR) repeat protein|nr:tetratricopeptide repeat protein [Candidatus Delongbacteria bacterium]